MTVLIDVPVGMLRISKDGEADRVIYPCHADRWQAQGWTIHPPVIPDLEPEEGTEPDPPGNGGGRPKPPRPDLGAVLDPVVTDNDLVALVPSDLNPDNLAPVEPEPSDPGPDSGPEPGTDPAAAEPPAAEVQVLDFETMTKAEIIAACEAHYGVTLDSHMTKAELVEEANLLAAQSTQPASIEPREGEATTEDSGSVVPDLL